MLGRLLWSDIRNHKLLMNTLSSLNREGTTILMVTHDSRMASRCGRILYLLDGQIRGELMLADVRRVL